MKLFIKPIGNGNRTSSEDTLSTSYYSPIPYPLSNTYIILILYIGKWDWIYKANKGRKLSTI